MINPVKAKIDLRSSKEIRKSVSRQASSSTESFEEQLDGIDIIEISGSLDDRDNTQRKQPQQHGSHTKQEDLESAGPRKIDSIA